MYIFSCISTIQRNEYQFNFGCIINVKFSYCPPLMHTHAHMHPFTQAPPRSILCLPVGVEQDEVMDCSLRHCLHAWSLRRRRPPPPSPLRSNCLSNPVAPPRWPASQACLCAAPWLSGPDNAASCSSKPSCPTACVPAVRHCLLRLLPRAQFYFLNSLVWSPQNSRFHFIWPLGSRKRVGCGWKKKVSQIKFAPLGRGHDGTE